jgi:fructose 1,6-bisphosphatase
MEDGGGGRFEESAVNLTLSVIKVDIGSVGGHIGPSRKLLDPEKALVAERGKVCLLDYTVGSTGDDIAAAMLPMGELEYTGITEKFAILDKAFKIRPPVTRADAA